METKIKRLMAVVLSLAMFLSVAPMGALAVENVVAEVLPVENTEYNWTFNVDLNTENKDNELKVILGNAKVENEQLHVDSGALEMTNAVNLSLDENWVVEWEIDGTIDRHVVLSSKPEICTDGAWYIFRYDNKYFLGTWYKNGYTNFLLSADGYTEGTHIFTMKCINGVISFAVDGETTCYDLTAADVYRATKRQTNAKVLKDYRAQLNDAEFPFKYVGSTHRSEFYANDTLDSLHIKKGIIDEVEYKWNFTKGLDTETVCKVTTEVSEPEVKANYYALLNDVVFHFKYLGSITKNNLGVANTGFYANDVLNSLRIEKDYVEKLDYNWTLFNEGYYTQHSNNKLEPLTGSEVKAEDGQLVVTSGALKMTNGVNLSASENWAVEWTINGTIDKHIMLASESDINTDGSWFILRNNFNEKPAYYLGTRYDNTYVNFLLSTDGYSDGSHTFTLKCVNGVISFAVDGETTCEDIKDATVCKVTTEVSEPEVKANYYALLNDVVFHFKYLGSITKNSKGQPNMGFYANDILNSLRIEKG